MFAVNSIYSEANTADISQHMIFAVFPDKMLQLE